MPKHRSFLRVHVASGTPGGAVWPWRVGAAAWLNPLLIGIGALGSGKSISFVVGGGEDR